MTTATVARLAVSVDTPRSARSVQLDGAYAYVGDLYWLRVFDVSIPSAPVEIASYKTPSFVDHLWVSDGTAYVAGYDAGLMIVALTGRQTNQSAQFEAGIEANGPAAN